MTRMASSQYSIGSPTRTCAATGQPLGVGTRYVAALVQTPLEPGIEGATVAPREEFARMDFSEDAWNNGSRPAASTPLLGFWRGVVPVDGAPKKLLIDDDALLDLFEQSGETPHASGTENAARDQLVFRFVLSLLLLRKRLLIQEGSREDGRVMLVRVKGTPSLKAGGDASSWIEVIDPGMDDEAIARVTMQLHAVLSDDAAIAPAAGGSQ